MCEVYPWVITGVDSQAEKNQNYKMVIQLWIFLAWYHENKIGY